MSGHETYDPFDLKGQEEARINDHRKHQHSALIEAEDLKWIMENRRGRRFVWRLLSKAGIYRSSFTGNSTTFFQEGMRNIGLMIVHDIHEVCPDQYSVMVKEAKKDGKDSRDSNDNDARK